jgi:3-isopropylmalate/(R)-2-methylmalate dehydratase small subunit
VIKNAGISAVLAKSFARIFFRNAINIGLNVLRLDTSSIRQGDRLKVDLAQGRVDNLTLGGETLITQPLPDFIQKILSAGGIKEYFKVHGDFDL